MLSASIWADRELSAWIIERFRKESIRKHSLIVYNPALNSSYTNLLPMSWFRFTSERSCGWTVYSHPGVPSAVSCTSLFKFPAECHCPAISAGQGPTLCKFKSIFLSTRSSMLTNFWQRTLYSVSSETFVWCFYKVLMEWIAHIDFLVRPFNTWTFSIALQLRKSNLFKSLEGHIPQLLWKPLTRPNLQSLIWGQIPVAVAVTGGTREPPHELPYTDLKAPSLS